MFAMLWLLSYVTVMVYGFAGLFCLAAGLLYVTELVEEYTVTTGKVIRYLIVSECFLQLIVFFTDQVTLVTTFVGLFAHAFYWSLLKHFPAFHFGSVPFIGSLVACALHHFVALRMFNSSFHTFTETLAYFTFLVWAVPFMYLISLSANDWVLPQTVPFNYQNREQEPLLSSGQDMVSAYLKKKRRSLYALLSAVRDCLPSLTSKKGF
ncbi:Protein tex261 [Clonorchis sinensis]|uniref:Protein TEX261 n=2 Tax=Clonorchis sinensis TaxID=79923 RepID=A0A8T1M9D4_CLOSI|nr:Protein tex261 [Clonorchis sinensis]